MKMWAKLATVAGVVVVGAGAVIVWASYSVARFECADAAETLSKAFSESQVARTLNLSAIESSGHRLVRKEGHGTGAAYTCTANILMNNAKTQAVEYVVQMRQDATYMLTFRALD